MPTTENDSASGSTPLALQRLFYNLQFEDTSVSTTDLTTSFEWAPAANSFEPHNLQAFNVMFRNYLRKKMKVHAPLRTGYRHFRRGSDTLAGAARFFLCLCLCLLGDANGSEQVHVWLFSLFGALYVLLSPVFSPFNSTILPVS
jgi:hypothetical protein